MHGTEFTSLPSNGARGPEATGRILKWAGVVYAVLLVTGFGWMAWVRGGWAEARRGLVGPSPVEGILVGVVVGVVIVLVSELLYRTWSVARSLEDEFRTILGPLTPVDCVLLASLSSLGEEIFFRGGLQGWLASFCPPVWALAITAILFGVMHFPMKRVFVWWTLFAVGMGFLFGWLAMVEAGLLAPMAVHAVVNGGNLWRMTSRRGPE
ncbi:MAG: CPBP family intramembrane metalloprotease [Planctomycetes bacterium]|nr:CPBP family intramembrane metalloprotease [Planctomycetota bacterium]